MAKMEIMFDGFKDLAEMIDKQGGDLKGAVDEALTETQKLVQGKVEAAAAPYAIKGGGKGYATGAMYRTIIRNPEITWAGNIATVEVGFDLKAPGGFHSIFLMYGTPRIRKNQQLFNAIKGSATRKEIAALQEKILSEKLEIGG